MEHISVMSEMVRLYGFLSRHFFFDGLLPLNQGLWRPSGFFLTRPEVGFRFYYNKSRTARLMIFVSDMTVQL